MADVTGKYEEIMGMIEFGRYFIINRPRQYGKTTALNYLTESLNKKEGYLALRISFEGVGNLGFEDEASFCDLFLDLLRLTSINLDETKLVSYLSVAKEKIFSIKNLSVFISDLVLFFDKKIVILIDEVDKSSNNQLFLHFLGMLRDKYLDRDTKVTFHSVVLAGVHDVKTLKLKLRKDEETKYNSPWNIATDFKVNMNLLPHEIVPMLQEYAVDKEIQLDANKIADLLFYYTSGYPFLVSKLCKMFDEEILPTKPDKTWTDADIETCVWQLEGESNTNFDDLIKNLENNPELYQLVESLLIAGKSYPYTINDPIINLGVIYGIFSNQNGLVIHNRIYREVIYSYMTMRALRNQEHVDREFFGAYILPGNHLDVEKILLRFQNLLREEYSKKDRDFLERQGRLLFLAFLKPLLNGHGHAFKEPQISEEKRLDLIISYFQHKYVAELKIWRGEKAHKTGILQLVDYLNRQGLDKGYLLIFDNNEVKEWKTQRIRKDGKKIFAVWV
jgi:hypothetical protein